MRLFCCASIVAVAGCAPSVDYQHLDPRINVDACADDGTATCALDFGNVDVGDSEGHAVVIENDSALVLKMALSFADGSDATFAVAPTAEVQADVPGEVVLTFAPVVAGPATATLVIEADADDAERVEVAITGVGVCRLSVSPTNCDFGDVDVGAEGFCDVTVDNDGGCTGVLDEVVVNGGGVFSLVDDPVSPQDVAAGQSVVLTVRAAPFTDGVAIGTVTVNGTTITLRVDA